MLLPFWLILNPNSGRLFEIGFFIGFFLWISMIFLNMGLSLEYRKQSKEISPTRDFGLESTLRIQLEKKKIENQKPEKRLELEQKQNVVEQLLAKDELLKAIKMLEIIVEKAKLYKFDDILSWAENDLNMSKLSKIKQTILDLGVKFSRLELREISERTGIFDEDLIKETIMKMMENKEIYGEYFSSTKSVVFEKQTNIDEIDKLLATYKEWEEKQLGKKVS